MAGFSTNSLFAYSFRHSWLILYLVLNILATYIMLESGELIGDTQGEKFNENAVVLSFLMVACSYIFLLWPVFNFIYRIKVAPRRFACSEEVIDERIGKIVLLLQCVFMASNLMYGTSIAGAGDIKSGHGWTTIFVLLDPDFLFFIYYGICRERRLFYPNVIVFTVSNLLRGWNGIFLFILFFETCRSYRNGFLTVNKIALILILSITLYPIISSAKWAIRANAFSNTSLVEMIPVVIDQLGSAEAKELIVGGMEQMVGRLQSVSLLADVMQRGSQLQRDFDANKFLPFWLEGLHGVVYDRLLLGNLFSGGERMSVGVTYAEYLYGSLMGEGVGNAAISYPGWFFIAPYLIPFYIVYTISLGWMSIYLVKKISGSESAKDMVWLAWLMYLLAPWLGAMFKLIYSVFFFLVIKIALTKIPKLKIRFM